MYLILKPGSLSGLFFQPIAFHGAAWSMTLEPSQGLWGHGTRDGYYVLVIWLLSISWVDGLHYAGIRRTGCSKTHYLCMGIFSRSFLVWTILLRNPILLPSHLQSLRLHHRFCWVISAVCRDTYLEANQLEHSTLLYYVVDQDLATFSLEFARSLCRTAYGRKGKPQWD